MLILSEVYTSTQGQNMFSLHCPSKNNIYLWSHENNCTVSSNVVHFCIELCYCESLRTYTDYGNWNWKNIFVLGQLFIQIDQWIRSCTQDTCSVLNLPSFKNGYLCTHQISSCHTQTSSSVFTLGDLGFHTPPSFHLHLFLTLFSTTVRSLAQFLRLITDLHR